MKGQRWLATFTAIVGIFLLLEGGFTAWVIDAVHALQPEPNMPYSSAEEVAWAKSHFPVMYIVAIEGIGFGLAAFATAVAVLLKKPWARRVLLIGSLGLATTAGVAIVMAAPDCVPQALFILFCVSLWIEARKWKNDVASAL
jgi:hypothetical protein